MKLKLTLIALGISSLFCQKIGAQAGKLDIHIDLGYGFGVATREFQSDDGTSITAVPYSLGAGFDADLGATYMIGDHLGAALDLNYVMGMPVSYTTVGPNVVITHTYQGMLFGITPMLVLSANTESVNPYGKFGIVLGSASFTHKETESGERALSGTFIDTYDGGAAVGIYGAFGLQFPISSGIGLYIELYDRTLSYAPTTNTNTQTFDGVQKHNTITYVDKVDNTTAPDTDVKSYQPFSSAGIKVGVTINLSK